MCVIQYRNDSNGLNGKKEKFALRWEFVMYFYIESLTQYDDNDEVGGLQFVNRLNSIGKITQINKLVDVNLSEK